MTGTRRNLRSRVVISRDLGGVVSMRFHVLRAASALPVLHKTFEMTYYVYRMHEHQCDSAGMTDTHHSASYRLCTYTTNAVHEHTKANTNWRGNATAPWPECRRARQTHPTVHGCLAIVFTDLRAKEDERRLASPHSPCALRHAPQHAAASQHGAADASAAGWERA